MAEQVLSQKCPETFLEKLEKLSKRPQDLLAADKKDKSRVSAKEDALELCRALNGLAAMSKPRVSATRDEDDDVELPLVVNDFTSSQIWEQMKYHTDATCSIAKLTKKVNKLVENVDTEVDGQAEVSFADGLSDVEQDREDDSENEIDEEEGEGEVDLDNVLAANDDDDDEEEVEMDGDDEFADAVSEDDEIEEGEQEEEDEVAPKKKEKKVKPMTAAQKAKAEVEDDFFKLDAMEAFVQDAEKQEEKQRKIEAGEDVSEDEDFDLLAGDDDEDIDWFGEGDEGDDDLEQAAHVKFDDFFDGEVEQAEREKASSKSSKKSKKSKKSAGEDDEELDEEELAYLNSALGGGDASTSDMKSDKKKKSLVKVPKISKEDKELDQLLDKWLDNVSSGEESTDEEAEDDAPFFVPGMHKTRRVREEASTQFDSDDDDEDDEGEVQNQDGEMEQEGEDVAAASEEENDEADVQDDENQEETARKSITAMQKRLAKAQDEIEQLEQEQLEKKHWSVAGEATAHQRPLNSLLELHVDLPMSHFAEKRSIDNAIAGGYDDVDGDDQVGEDKPGVGEGFGKSKTKGVDLEKIILARIKEQLFDDVIAQTEAPPAKRAQDTGDDVDLDFKKSTVGLGELYAKQYEDQILNTNIEEGKDDPPEKKEAKRYFAKLMYTLDLMCNNHYTPKPVEAKKGDAHAGEAGAIRMEETIPLIHSRATRSAPDEQAGLRAKLPEKTREEMDVGEKKARRRAKKYMRKAAMKQRLESGNLTLEGKKQRDEKLAEKNKSAKEDAKKLKEGKDSHKRKKKLRSTELLAQAAMSTAEDLSRKGAKRAQRGIDQDPNAKTSKRIKL